MRKAISYCAMRVLISGSPNDSAGHLVRARPRRRASAGAWPRSMPGGFDRYSTGSPPRAELHALMLAGQEAAAPQPREQRLIVLLPRALRDHHDEGRQVLVLAAQAVAQPRAQAGPARLLRAGLDDR